MCESSQSMQNNTSQSGFCFSTDWKQNAFVSSAIVQYVHELKT